jgi:hypothetical protein
MRLATYLIETDIIFTFSFKEGFEFIKDVFDDIGKLEI